MKIKWKLDHIFIFSLTQQSAELYLSSFGLSVLMCGVTSKAYERYWYRDNKILIKSYCDSINTCTIDRMYYLYKLEIAIKNFYHCLLRKTFKVLYSPKYLLKINSRAGNRDKLFIYSALHIVHNIDKLLQSSS